MKLLMQAAVNSGAKSITFKIPTEHYSKKKYTTEILGLRIVRTVEEPDYIVVTFGV
jgi:hypothetical protein